MIKIKDNYCPEFKKLRTFLFTNVKACTKIKSTQFQTSNVFTPAATNFLNNRSYNSSIPKAYLNWILFDDQFNMVGTGSGAQQVGANVTFTVMVQTGITATKNGFLYVYVSNETPNINVYFDNLQVTHMKSPLLQEQSYYPFGLQMAGISDRALGKLDSKNKFDGGVNFEEDYGVNLYSTFFRNYDPQIGRFTGVDALSEISVDQNSYGYAINDPEYWNDPSGLKETTDNPPHKGWHWGGYGWLPNIGDDDDEVNEGGVSYLGYAEVDYFLNSGGTYIGAIGGNGGGSNEEYMHGGGGGYDPGPGPGDPKKKKSNGVSVWQITWNFGWNWVTGTSWDKTLDRVENYGTAAKMTAGWVLGIGADSSSFNNDRVANELRNSPGVNHLREQFYKNGQTFYHYDFGLKGLWDAGLNPIEQFVGSYDAYITIINGGLLQFKIINLTSLRSADYHITSTSWNIPPGYPGGNFSQIYIFTEPIKQ